MPAISRAASTPALSPFDVPNGPSTSTGRAASTAIAPADPTAVASSAASARARLDRTTKTSAATTATATPPREDERYIVAAIAGIGRIAAPRTSGVRELTAT